MMLGVTQKEDGLEGDGGWAEQSSAVQAVIAYFGPTDLTATDLPEPVKPVMEQFLGGTLQAKPDDYKKASPITYVGAGDAPMLLFQGTKDPLVPHTQAYRMLDALSAAGVPGRGEILLGAGHGWPQPEWRRTAEAAFHFLDQHLKAKPPTPAR
jgi:dipeptidyl aminopeptidase/acylaminoacyl peptidase